MQLNLNSFVLFMRGVENVKIYQYEDRLIQLSKELIFYLIKTGSTKEDAQDIAQEVPFIQPTK